MATLSQAGTVLASAQPVGHRGSGLGTLLSAAPPVPHAIGEARWTLAAVSAMCLGHWFGGTCYPSLAQELF